MMASNSIHQLFGIISMIFLIFEDQWPSASSSSISRLHNNTNLTPTLTKNGVFTCPPSDLMSPCRCYDFSNGTIECVGPSVRQMDIENAIRLVRETNGFLATDWMTLSSFSLQQANLTELDMTPLFYIQMDTLSIIYNENLSKILPNTDLPLISPVRLDMYKNQLTNQDLSQLFTFLTPSLMFLHGEGNDLKFIDGGYEIPDGSGDHEFLPGLYRFPKIHELYLGSNRMEQEMVEISGGVFKRLKNLRSLSLQFSAGGILLGAQAFLLDEPDEVLDEDERFWIFLSRSKLNDTSFDSSMGSIWQGTKRTSHLVLDSNELEFLHESHFRGFLEENEKNGISASNNLFVCDERMKWLKDGRAQFERRVFSVDCTNDPGENVFTTELIPSS